MERGDNHLLSGGSLGPSGTPVHVPMMSSGMPTGSALAPTLPTVSASLAALEQELHMLKVSCHRRENTWVSERIMLSLKYIQNYI